MGFAPQEKAERVASVLGPSGLTRRFAPFVPGVHHIPYPYTYRGTRGGPEEQEAFALNCARYIEDKLFKTILPAEEVAAIILEPIQGEGGYVVAPDNFLQEIRHAGPPSYAVSTPLFPVRLPLATARGIGGTPVQRDKPTGSADGRQESDRSGDPA